MQETGIYYISGDAIPMQVLILKELPKTENYWLSSLRKDLKERAEIQELLKRYEFQKDDKDYQAVMDVIIRANWDLVKEEKRDMCEALRELFAEELEESKEEGRQAGMEEGRQAGLEAGLELAKSVFKLSAQGLSLREIADKCEISVDKVEQILE